MKNREVVFRFENEKEFSNRGVFLAFGIGYSNTQGTDQHTVALIENDNGEIIMLSVYNVKFVNPLLKSIKHKN